MFNHITLELTPLQAECLATLIDAYVDRHSNTITLLDGDSGVMYNVLQEILHGLPDATRYYRIGGKYTVGYTTSIADALFYAPLDCGFTEITQAEWDNLD